MTKKKKDEKKVDYKVEVEKLPDSMVNLKFIVPAKELDRFIQDSVKEFAAEMKIDGFRKGVAPRKVVEAKAGKDQIIGLAIEKVVKKVFVDAIVSQEIDSIDQPKVELKKIAEGNDLEFEAKVPVLPMVKLKESWEDSIKKINKEVHKEDEVKIEKEEVEKELNYLANQRAKLITVNREARKGDQVEVDFQVYLDGVIIEGGSAQKHPIIIGENKFIPGFEEQLVGTKTSEEKKFKLKFPKDYHAKDLAGKETDFEVKVGLIQERQIPVIDDTFASGIGKFKDLSQLKKDIEKAIEEEKKRVLSEKHKRKLIDVLVENAQFKVPEILIERELESMLAELEADVAKMGLDKDTYLKQTNTTEEGLKKQWRADSAPKRVMAALILKKLSKDYKIEPTKDEVQARVNGIVQQFALSGQGMENLDINRIYEMAKGGAVNEKTFEALMKIQ